MRSDQRMRYTDGERDPWWIPLPPLSDRMSHQTTPEEALAGLDLDRSTLLQIPVPPAWVLGTVPPGGDLRCLGLSDVTGDDRWLPIVAAHHRQIVGVWWDERRQLYWAGAFHGTSRISWWLERCVGLEGLLQWFRRHCNE